MPLILCNFPMKLEGLRQQLHEGEDGRFKGQRELIEAHRELQGCAQERDKLRKDAVDLRRLLGNETREKEAIQASNQELRALVKQAESVWLPCKARCYNRPPTVDVYHIF